MPAEEDEAVLVTKFVPDPRPGKPPFRAPIVIGIVTAVTLVAGVVAISAVQPGEKTLAQTFTVEKPPAKDLFIETYYGNGVYYFSMRPGVTIYFDNAPPAIGSALADFIGKNPGLHVESVSPLFDEHWIKGYFVITSKRETR